MKTRYVYVYSIPLQIGIDLEITETLTLNEFLKFSAQFMEKETHGQFYAHENNHLIRCLNHTFMHGTLCIKEIGIQSGECFYLL